MLLVGRRGHPGADRRGSMGAQAWVRGLVARPAFWPAVGLLLWVPLLPFLLGLYPIVRFPREQIDIHVYPEHVVVEAWYVYTNPFPIPVAQGYALPLPVGPQHPAPTEVWAKRLDAEEEIPLWLFRGTHRFSLPFAPRETLTVYAHYRQHTPTRNAWYILTSTRGWHRPLESGLYRLFPHGVRLVASNYPLEARGPDCLGFHRTDFLPTEEWQFAWEVE